MYPCNSYSEDYNDIHILYNVSVLLFLYNVSVLLFIFTMTCGKTLKKKFTLKHYISLY